MNAPKKRGERRSESPPAGAAVSAASWQLMQRLFRSHPWHGAPIGAQMPEVVTVYIEIVPTDTVKYELDKDTGYLRGRPAPAILQRLPRRSTASCRRPTAASGWRARRAGARADRDIVGDGDPLDICVLTEKSITHGDILLAGAADRRPAHDRSGDEADDKIIAVLEGDASLRRVARHPSMPSVPDRPAAPLLPHVQERSRRARAASRDHPRLRLRGSPRSGPAKPRRLPLPLPEMEALLARALRRRSNEL